MSAAHRVSNDDLKGSKLFDVSHVTALVTGGGTGIGLMITQALVSNGAKVYITGRREEALQAVVKQYSGPGEIIALPGDVSQKDDIKRLATEMSSNEPKGIHLLVNNAGIARDQETQFSKAGEPDLTSAQSVHDHFMSEDPSAWTETFQTNVTAGYFMSMAFLPLLVKAKESTPGYAPSVVNVSSISGAMKGSSGGQFAYAASKAAFTHVSRMLATTYSKVGVRVNVIAPGLFPSEMTTDESGSDQKSDINKKLSNPAGRPGTDTDMAATILFLAGPGGLFYNEQIMYPDGGATLVQPAAK
ncbi:NAD(P)-binding protein [Aulographum hederae CBS 113979]|uniref:NAD(P)-binding protein n=1 Tax=Aulographum hederae CBS 113979 TaxID=1176131 RepID=A0A6G1H982_9PEZI|nr:NAD(P)-binding protein [Aulographum hederae CBS 113979]